MSVEKLKRVIMRLRQKFPENTEFGKSEIEEAIMIECGTDEKTVRSNRRALLRLGWISWKNNKVRLTEKALVEDY